MPASFRKGEDSSLFSAYNSNSLYSGLQTYCVMFVVCVCCLKVQDPSPVSFEVLCFRLLTAGFGAPSHIESVQDKAGWGFVQPDLVKGLAAQGGGAVSSCPFVAVCVKFPSQFNTEYSSK